MKVLFLSQIVPYPPHGGVLQRGFNIIRELGRRAELHLLAFVHPDVLPTADSIAASRRALGEFCTSIDYFSLWPKRSPAHKATALAAGLASTLPFSRIAHRSAAFQRSVARALEEGAFDLVHVDTVALSQFVDPQKVGAATVLTHHNIESQLMQRRAEVETRPLAAWFLRREAKKLHDYELEVSPGYDVNIFMSSNDEALLANRVSGIRSAVVPNGVDIAYFTPDTTPVTPTLIYTGGMNMFANKDAVMWFLSDVWPAITAVNPEVRFCVVGQDPPKELKAAASRDRRIVVTGYVDDIRPFVRTAAVYVVPLRVGGGTRLKVLDAMASGKAIVSTSVGCEGIDVTAGEHLLVADTPHAFAQTTIALLANPAQQRALGAAARVRAEQRYGWSAMGDRLMDAYARALESRAGTAARMRSADRA